ncbi:iron-containing alcohol dehydrogenase [Sphingomonas immobilis]|uniref:Iron-containing alcohol dehydrogenase n=1 Tax=Sphingomonas immobilis TaxID=3063997 RepID=A0ABT9A348_9SPHN|nr:iron-containing alcohol dehydrogenase [Sphingomonas sp. CA1-15]MDO7843411.1 iron-containing alcohol dehydrogenase [Sphingomonas sp. CA1-15]
MRFTYGPKLIVGAGSADEMDALLPAGAVLFVTDAGVRGLGLADSAIAALEAAGRTVLVFDAVEADPSATTVEAATAAGRSAGAVAVIGFGGGSPMDVAKIAAYLLGSGDGLDTIYGVDQARGARLPLVLVPTTAGTGSEATPVAIVTVGGAEKKGVVAPALYADYAILDAALTAGLPAHVTAATGIDAMVHAIEAYTSARLKNPLSDMLAREALGLIAANLRRVIAQGDDLAAREAMLLGAHLAGIAFANAPVAGVHALAYPLGGHFHVPHGLSNALMLPHVLRHNMAAAMPLYAELGAIIDPALAPLGDQARAQGLVEAVTALALDCGLPDRLRAVGVTEDHLDLLSGEAMKQQRLLINNPCPIDEEDARRLYAAAL